MQQQGGNGIFVRCASPVGGNAAYDVGERGKLQSEKVWGEIDE
jgi:hypothetical protein